MRHKQRPVKSSRHKSVTFIIDSQTSFAGQQQASAGNSIAIADHHPANRHSKAQNSQSLLLNSPASSSASFVTNPHKRQQNEHQRPQRSTSSANYGSASSSSHNNINSQSTSGSSPASFNGANNRSSLANLRMPTIAPTAPQTKTILATNDSDTSHEQSLLRKQFEHNNGYRHMSDVMRLAFLENNDISIDDCSNIDFNSLSTASILQRNIQQQLLQQRRDQLQFRQQHRQQQQHQQQQNYRQQRHHQQKQQQRQQHNQNHRQETFHDEDAEFDDVDDYGDQDIDDYEISDSRIFATASTPTGSANGAANIRTNLGTSTPKSVIQQRQRQRQQQQLLHQQQQQQLQQLQQQFQLQQPSGSGVHQNQHNRHDSSGVIEASDIDMSIKRRPRESVQRVEFPNRVETLQNYGEGFFCDEPGCGKSFPSIRKLRHHKVVHSDDFPFICEFNGCAKKFKRKFGIDLHSTTHFDLDPEMYSKTSNNSSLPFFGRRMQYSMCKPCGQKFKTVHEYQYHMLKHGKEPFKCPVKGCGQTFGIWKSFQKHRASHYFNYYCKMDPQCTHHTSNLQLLKLHIYCCHFRRKLPENATLASKDPDEDESARSEHVDVAENEDTPHKLMMKDEDEAEGEGEELMVVDDDGSESLSVADSPPKRPEPSTPRRDSRLRKNPPRSSTFGQQDYASINNGSSFAKSITLTPTPKRTRSTLNSSDSSAVGSQFASNEKSDNSIEVSTKKRPREPVQRVDISNNTSVETAQNYCEGFFCDEPGCGKSFPSIRKLRHHKVVHSDDFPFICEFNGCAKKFKRKFGIDLHSTTHFDLDPEMYSKTSNNSSLPFFGRRMQYSMCKPCGQKFKTVHEYQYHMLKHGKEPFKCPVKGCGQTFGIWKSFQKHRASHYFNYYCKMDPQCTHHTSNLQLLKLHIYCCHFRRKLPENATLASKDPDEDDSIRDEHIDVVESEDMPQNVVMKSECDEDEEQSISVANSPVKQPEPSTPRRDSRLRKNPPRSSTFGQQDYASINNGSSFAKSTTSTPTLKRTRATMNSSGPQSIDSQSTPPEKKMKLPLKVLPKRSAQRLPMSLIADDASTEEDDVHTSEGESSLVNDHDEDGETDADPSKRHKFKCHLCDYQFSVRFQLTKHLSTHLELTADMYSATADKQVVQLSERRRREFYCDKCSVKFEQMQDLDAHMRKHGTRPYVCNFCQIPSTFRLAKQYLSHLYEHRFNYQCMMELDCGFTINRKDALKLHIFRMHLNQQLPSYIENFANMIDDWPEQ